MSDRLLRIRQAPALAGDAFARWRAARAAIVGAGAVGAMLGEHLVRRGLAVLLIDPDLVSAPNLGTQPYSTAALGRPKVDALVDTCAAIEPGRAAGIRADVRGVGAGVLAACDLLIDCSDDAALAMPLTLLANGLRRPLLRLAVDGSGERELCRALVSHGGADHACQLCPLSPSDLLRATARTPCPGAERERPPTLAGAAVPAAVALGILQAQRLLSHRDIESALDHELVLDLGAAALHALHLQRSPRCLSAHARWQIVDLPRTVDALTLRELFDVAERHLQGDVSLIPENGPLSLSTLCACGARALCVGALHAPPPACAQCGAGSVRRPEAALAGVSRAQAAELEILDIALAGLGLPDGAAVAARARHGSRVHFVARLANPGCPFDTP